jgi:hypothetical protein
MGTPRKDEDPRGAFTHPVCLDRTNTPCQQPVSNNMSAHRHHPSLYSHSFPSNNLTITRHHYPPPRTQRLVHAHGAVLAAKQQACLDGGAPPGALPEVGHNRCLRVVGHLLPFLGGQLKQVADLGACVRERARAMRSAKRTYLNEPSRSVKVGQAFMSVAHFNEHRVKTCVQEVERMTRKGGGRTQPTPC